MSTAEGIRGDGLFHMRCTACWCVAAIGALIIASFATLGLQWGELFSMSAVRSMGKFLGEFFPPDLSPAFTAKVLKGAWETLAMSLVGTLLAVAAWCWHCLPAACTLPTLRLGVASPGWC
jgi:phosphonate transport system permease protein